MCFRCDGEAKEEAAYRRGFARGHEEGLQEGIEEGMKKAPRPPAVPSLDLTQLSRLIQLCHPDKHQNSRTSTEVTQMLLEKRRALRGSQG
jgi:hypothetical protein